MIDEGTGEGVYLIDCATHGQLALCSTHYRAWRDGEREGPATVIPPLAPGYDEQREAAGPCVWCARDGEQTAEVAHPPEEVTDGPAAG